MTTTRFTRRTALRGLAGLALLPIAAACGSGPDKAGQSSTSSGSGSAAPTSGGRLHTTVFAASGTIKFQLSYLKNIESAGEYIADSDGYYTKAGFAGVNLIAGPTAVEAAIASGAADVGYTTAIGASSLIVKEKMPIKIIGVLSPKSPFAIMSPIGAGAITKPSQLVGKRIMVPQGTAPLLVEALLAANGIAKDSVKFVPGFGALDQLKTGDIDCYFSFITDELVNVKNGKVTALLMSDNGLPTSGLALGVTDKAIAADRDAIKAFLKAEVEGWQEAISNPSKAVDLTMTKYGADLGLDREDEQENATSFAKFLLPEPDSKLFLLSDKQIDDNMKALSFAGIKLDAKDLFDMSLLQEMYQQHPELAKRP